MLFFVMRMWLEYTDDIVPLMKLLEIVMNEPPTAIYGVVTLFIVPLVPSPNNGRLVGLISSNMQFFIENPIGFPT